MGALGGGNPPFAPMGNGGTAARRTESRTLQKAETFFSIRGSLLSFVFLGGVQMEIGGYISVTCAAQIKGRDPSYIRRLCRDGRVQAIKLGHDWLVEEDSLMSFRPKFAV